MADLSCSVLLRFDILCRLYAFGCWLILVSQNDPTMTTHAAIRHARMQSCPRPLSSDAPNHALHATAAAVDVCAFVSISLSWVPCVSLVVMPSESSYGFHCHSIPDFDALTWKVFPLGIVPDVGAMLLLLAAAGIE